MATLEAPERQVDDFAGVKWMMMAVFRFSAMMYIAVGSCLDSFLRLTDFTGLPLFCSPSTPPFTPLLTPEELSHFEAQKVSLTSLSSSRHSGYKLKAAASVRLTGQPFRVSG
ncbi:hypothetical protein CFC21_097194 [Triticum aestivum]|uniref:Uncharacterized protein n=4 Tax=Triticum TaxID=4564 RepID=A0A9R0Z845_TRITD|nr:hypothetical protein TRIUR3_20286 [Triticum urartu]KAF7094924.1 hypothetical protein CFC21_097194 [Triticum aestivum]VAI73103.1 unnamed protein product [Triticum turgidum subsp. durum]